MNKKRKIVAYLRVSTDEQDVKNQELEILRYCQEKNLRVNHWIKSTSSSKKSQNKRKVNEIIDYVNSEGFSTLIVTEVSRLSRTLGEMLVLLEKLENEFNVEVIATKDGEMNNLPEQFKLMRRIFAGYFAQEERRIISQRTREALASKKQSGIKLGKPLGSIQKSIYDSKKEEIILLLDKKIPITNIVKIIGIGKQLSLRTYLRKRKII